MWPSTVVAVCLFALRTMGARASLACIAWTRGRNISDATTRANDDPDRRSEPTDPERVVPFVWTDLSGRVT